RAGMWKDLPERKNSPQRGPPWICPERADLRRRSKTTRLDTLRTSSSYLLLSFFSLRAHQPIRSERALRGVPQAGRHRSAFSSFSSHLDAQKFPRVTSMLGSPYAAPRSVGPGDRKCGVDADIVPPRRVTHGGLQRTK